MITGELFRFCGILSNEEMTLAEVNEIELNEKQYEIFRESVKLFVECGFEVKCPRGLSAVELAEYFLAKKKYRLEEYRNMFLMQREMFKLPEEVTPQDVMEGARNQENVKLQALELAGRMALEL